jgi:hypothetical protein
MCSVEFVERWGYKHCNEAHHMEGNEGKLRIFADFNVTPTPDASIQNRNFMQGTPAKYVFAIIRLSFRSCHRRRFSGRE